MHSLYRCMLKRLVSLHCTPTQKGSEGKNLETPHNVHTHAAPARYIKVQSPKGRDYHIYVCTCMDASNPYMHAASAAGGHDYQII